MRRPARFYMLEEKRVFKNVMIDKSVPFEKLVNLAVNGENLFEDDEDFIRSRLFIVDDLLCHIIAYSTWKTGDKKYDETKSKLLEVGIVYEMLFMIVEDRNEEDFVNNLSTFKTQISQMFELHHKLHASICHCCNEAQQTKSH